MAPGKRLGNLLKIAEDTPAKSVTWLVDPAVLDDAPATGRAHTSCQNARTGSQQKATDPTALRWLDDLRTALAGHPVVATALRRPRRGGPRPQRADDDHAVIAIAKAGRSPQGFSAGSDHRRSTGRSAV